MAEASNPPVAIEHLSADGSDLAPKERLVASALDAFAELGYHGTTTREIAARAGMSPAGLYVHHESKRALLFEIVRRAAEDVLTRVRAAAGQRGTAAERLGRVVEAVVSYHAVRSREALVANHELHWLKPEERAVIVRSRDEIEETVRGLIAEGSREGEFDVVDMELAMIAVFSLCVDVARWRRPSRQPDVAALASAYRELVLRMLGGRNLAPAAS